MNLYLYIIIVIKSQVLLCFLGVDLLELIMDHWKYIDRHHYYYSKY